MTSLFGMTSSVDRRHWLRSYEHEAHFNTLPMQISEHLCARRVEMRNRICLISLRSFLVYFFNVPFLKMRLLKFFRSRNDKCRSVKIWDATNFLVNDACFLRKYTKRLKVVREVLYVKRVCNHSALCLWMSTQISEV